MAVQVVFPSMYRPYTGGQTRVQTQSPNVSELLRDLVNQYPELQERLLDQGKMAPYLMLYVNGVEVRQLAGEETKLRPGDQVFLVPAVAGGALKKRGEKSGKAEFESEAPLLDKVQLDRYARHTSLPEVGIKGQRKLLNSKVLVVGAGGLGSPAALYLAAAGVGTLGIIDGDRVERSNLQRQLLHDERTLGMPKARSARERLNLLNPDVRVNAYEEALTPDNVEAMLREYQVVVNGCDNFPTRYLLNDACVLGEKPLVDAAILRFEGQATVFLPGEGCYRCLFPSPPPPGNVPSCAEAGVIGALAGQLGAWQAMQTIKLLLGVGRVPSDQLYIYDALDESHYTVNWFRRSDCPVCGDNPTITRLVDYDAHCGIPGHDTRPETNQLPPEYDLEAEDAARLVRQGATVIDVRARHEYSHGVIPGSWLIPLEELADQVHLIEPDQQVLLVCQVGERSGRAVSVLRDANFPAFNLKGGLVAWVNRGLPLQQPDETAGEKE